MTVPQRVRAGIPSSRQAWVRLDTTARDTLRASVARAIAMASLTTLSRACVADRGHAETWSSPLGIDRPGSTDDPGRDHAGSVG